MKTKAVVLLSAMPIALLAIGIFGLWECSRISGPTPALGSHAEIRDYASKLSTGAIDPQREDVARMLMASAESVEAQESLAHTLLGALQSMSELMLVLAFLGAAVAVGAFRALQRQEVFDSRSRNEA